MQGGGWEGHKRRATVPMVGHVLLYATQLASGSCTTARPTELEGRRRTNDGGGFTIQLAGLSNEHLRRCLVRRFRGGCFAGRHGESVGCCTVRLSDGES
jgi:hypothetical protein